VHGVIDHAQQSAYSEPGEWRHLFDEVAPTVDAVGAMARNLIAHYRAQEDALPAETRDDIDLRWVEAMLATDQQRHDGKGITVERPLPTRLQGCCRDHTLIAVAALRHHGIPARSRVGFAPYLAPASDWRFDHVVVEAWIDGQWYEFDPEFAGPIPGPFLTAAHAWLAHRAGEIDVSRFGAAPGIGIDGDWFVFGNVINQVAHRFGDELLLWDGWGAKTFDLATTPPEDIALLDEVAELLERADALDLGAEQALLDVYRDDARLRPSTTVRCASPSGTTAEIDLTRRRA
jgi:hypothetical protein